MDHASAQQWLDRYVAAWRSYDPAAIAALFSADVSYRYHPWDDPVIGRDAVVGSWLGDDEPAGASAGSARSATTSRDRPGTYDAEYSVLAVDGDVVVARGVSRYRERPDGPIVRVYDNCFLIRFDAAGDCREFTEFYMLRPDSTSA